MQLHWKIKLTKALCCLALLPTGVATPINVHEFHAATRRAQLEDIDTIRREYMPKEMAYSPAMRDLAEAQLGRLEQQAGKMTPAEFQTGLAIVGALTDNAHSGLRRWEPEAVPTLRLPVRLLWLSDKLVIARAFDEYAELAGATVLKLEGRSPEAFYEASKVLVGGNEPARKHWLNGWIESHGVLRALNLAQHSDRIGMQLKLKDGRVVERTLRMLPVKKMEPFVDPVGLWSPVLVRDESGWKPAIDNQDIPLYLQDPEKPFRTLNLPDLEAQYIQFRWNQDDEKYSIADFIEDVGKEIAEHAPYAVIVDHRFNVGGNLLTTIEFMRSLPSLVDGPIYLLVGHYTFSAGIISAGALKKAGGDRVVVVGDELGDRTHFWSEGGSVVLPNSRYSFRYTNGQFNVRHGCTGEPGCMDDMYDIGVNGISLAPEIMTPLTSVDYFEKRDPALQAVKSHLRAANIESRQEKSK